MVIRLIGSRASVMMMVEGSLRRFRVRALPVVGVGSGHLESAVVTATMAAIWAKKVEASTVGPDLAMTAVPGWMTGHELMLDFLVVKADVVAPGEMS
jgi:hypothetical protein